MQIYFQFHTRPRTVLLLFFLFQASAQAASHAVNMKSISYEPKTLQIKVGDTVEWKNKSLTEHSASFDEPKDFDTGMVAPDGASKKLAFTTAGTFNYHCSLHGKTMSGRIVVQH